VTHSADGYQAAPCWCGSTLHPPEGPAPDLPGDLLIITPTRGREKNAQRLIDAVAATCTARTDLILAVDDDDAGSYADLKPGAAEVVRGPRVTFSERTNRIAAGHGPGYRAVASLGDDHLPHTTGWDAAILAALDDMGGTGIVYGNDIGQGENLPTAVVISTDIVAALGWMCLPACDHYYVDAAWLDLGREAGCLRYLPDVIVEHLHYSRGASPNDQTYADHAGSWQHDEAAYRAWRRNGMAADVDKIRKLRADAGAVKM
jgi:hypothetical protein